MCVCEICGSINYILYWHFPPSCEVRKILLLRVNKCRTHTQIHTCMYAQGLCGQIYLVNSVYFMPLLEIPNSHWYIKSFEIFLKSFKQLFVWLFIIFIFLKTKTTQEQFGKHHSTQISWSILVVKYYKDLSLLCWPQVLLQTIDAGLEESFCFFLYLDVSIETCSLHWININICLQT